MTDDGVTRLPPDTCPCCQHTIDAAGTMDGEPGAPAAGDWTLCAYCLRWLVYLDGMRLREITLDEWDALPPDMRGTLRAHRARVHQAFRGAR